MVLEIELPMVVLSARFVFQGCMATRDNRIGSYAGKDACFQYCVPLDYTGDFLDWLVNCRRAEFARVKKDYKARCTTRELVEQRLAPTRQQLDKDYRIAGSISANVVKRRDAFLDAAYNITPGTRTRLQEGAAELASARKTDNKRKQQQPVSNDPATQTIAPVTTAYQCSERVVQAPAQFQNAKLEAS